MRIALAHDWLVGYRGGEAVLDAIARTLAADGHELTRIYTMFDDGRPLTPTLDALPRRASFLNRAGGGFRRWLLPAYPLAVNELSRKLARDHAAWPIDLLISTSSAAIKGLKAPRGVRHVCYCHAPARYLWSIADEYQASAHEGVAGTLRSLGLRAFGPVLRAWDRRTAQCPPHGTVDVFLANSTATAGHVRRCYGRESAVLFPPVRTDFFIPDLSKPRENFWLIAGALEPYKRTDLAIRAAALSSTRLVVVGDGTQRRALESLARGLGAPVEFLGRVGDERLRELYRTARLFLFPQIEDFGITAVEAQACGCPVVARRMGGALDTVVDGVTGSLFDQPTPDALVDAAARCPPPNTACRHNVERFSEDAFARGLRSRLFLV